MCSSDLASGLTLAEGDFQSGWNLLSSADNKTPSQLNSSLGGSLQSSGKAVVTVWAWDAPSIKWRFYAPSIDALGGSALGNYIAANGYLPFETVLSVSDGFWVNIVSTAVAAALSLDLNNLFNYAAPVLPAHYDSAALALDNSPASVPVGDSLNKAATLGRVLFSTGN